jgi:hypothetical protein
MLRLAAVATLAAALGAPTIVAGDASPQALGTLLKRWVTAVETHRPGEVDEPVTSLARWPDLDLSNVIEAVAGAVVRYRRGAQTEPQDLLLPVSDELSINRLLKRAAVLHADIARLAAPALDRVGPPRRGGSGAVPVDDGEAARLRGNAIHWSLGLRLVQLVLPGPAVDPFVGLWHRSAAAHQLHALEYNYALPQLTAILRTVKDDAVLLRYAGMAHEHTASPAVQSSLRDLDLPFGFAAAVGSAESELRQARALMARAVEADASSAEARLRFGRVLTLLGEPDRAAAELTKALADATTRHHQYYAALFLGRAEELRERVTEARAGAVSAGDLAAARSQPPGNDRRRRRRGRRHTSPGALARIRRQ